MPSDLFTQHEAMTKMYGVSLLHRHFDMKDDEVLVEHGSTSTPWVVPPEPENFMDGRIMPRSWCFSDDTAEPHAYEFGFVSNGGESELLLADPTAHAEFVVKFWDILKRNGLTTVLGLTALSADYLPGDNRSSTKFERTFERANVVFDVNPDALQDKSKRTSIWTFGKETRMGQQAMLCFSGCYCGKD